MEFQEVKPKESSSFRDGSFIGIIKDIAYQEKKINEDLRDMVCIIFEDGVDLDFFEPDDWGEMEDYKGVGRIVSDLRKIGIKWLVHPGIKQIKTVPDIKGLEVRLKLTKTEKTVNGEPKTYRNWNLEVVDPKMIGKTSSNPSKDEPKEDNSEILRDCEKEIVSILTKIGGSGQEIDIIKGITAKYTDVEERKPLQEVRKQVIQEMIKTGIIMDDVGTYTLI